MPNVTAGPLGSTANRDDFEEKVEHTETTELNNDSSPWPTNDTSDSLKTELGTSECKREKPNSVKALGESHITT